MATGGLSRQAPEARDSRDLRAVLRQMRYHGQLERDPERPIDGDMWVRTDTEPPELRVRLKGVTYKVDLTEV